MPRKPYHDVTQKAFALIKKYADKDKGYWMRRSAAYLALQYREHERRGAVSGLDFSPLLPVVGAELEALEAIEKEVMEARPSLIENEESAHLWQEIHSQLASGIAVRENAFNCLTKAMKEDGLCRL